MKEVPALLLGKNFRLKEGNTMATNYISGETRITGLGFDLDFDGILENMYKLECLPRNRFTVWKNDWQTRVNAFQELNTEMLSLKRTMDSLNTVNKFLSKSATVSKDTVLSATSSPDTPEGIYNIDVKQIARTATVTFEGRRFAAGAKINNSGTDGTFTYSYKGKQYSINVPNDTKIEQFVSLLNNDQKNPGVVASLVKDGNGNQILQIRGKDLGASATLTIDGYKNLNFDSTQTSKTAFTDGSDVLSEGKFVYSYGDTTYTITTEQLDEEYGSHTLDDLINYINTKDQDGVAPVKASLDASGHLVLEEADPSRKLGVTVSANTTITGLDTFTGISAYDAGEWDVMEPLNAKYSINGWPKEGLESTTNSLVDAIPGMTILLKSEGETQVSVNANIEGVKENIVKFVEGYNTVMLKIQELTKVDESKDVVDTDKTNSLYDSQMGSVLTGNYGVQTIASKLKTSMAAKGTGFEYAQLDLDGNLISGDRFSSLSQIGIKTVTDQGDDMFGLLTIDEEALEKALSKDMNAVVELLAAGGNGTTDSADFTYDSYIPGTTQSGTYDVRYDVEMEYVNKQAVEADGTPKVDANGNPVYEQETNSDGSLKVDADGNPVYVQEATGKYIITNAFINGKPAKVNQEDRLITATTSGDPSAGLAIMVNNMAPGSYTGEVRLKGGKASDMSAVLSQLNNSETGTLPILIKNYETIMDRIDTKIDFENNRLALWQRTQQQRFARLETTLSNYQSQLNALESQLKSLSSSSSSK